MRSVLFILMVVLLNSCMLLMGWEHYQEKDAYGRKSLYNMKFKKSFKPEMTKQIDVNVVYYNFYEAFSINSKTYRYIRLFSDGQYAIFSSSNYDSNDINNLFEPHTVGYYNVKRNKLLLEAPTHDLYDGRGVYKYKILRMVI